MTYRRGLPLEHVHPNPYKLFTFFYVSSIMYTGLNKKYYSSPFFLFFGEVNIDLISKYSFSESYSDFLAPSCYFLTDADYNVLLSTTLGHTE